MNQEKNYDYIILGGGAAGLSLAHRMAVDPAFSQVRVAIVEQSSKDKNDRTWCYWETGTGYYDPIVKKSWDKIHFYSKTLDKAQEIAPYKYKMIAGIDFYNHVLPILDAAPNVTVIYDSVINIDESITEVSVQLSKATITGSQIFKSYPSIATIDKEEHIYVDQHFKGYFIETAAPSFDPGVATFMDFRIEQDGDARFLYVLPESETKALVEVALFSNQLLQQNDYHKILKDYIKDFLEIEDYKIEEEEFGIIPMTTYPFKKHNTDRIFHIGTGGGIVKASSGFAFNRIQQHTDQLIDCIKRKKPLAQSYDKLHGRHLFYDKVMLYAMLRNGVSGEEIFTTLFRKRTAPQIFKFLDQETSHLEDIGIFRAPPMWPFTKSFFQLLLGNR